MKKNILNYILFIFILLLFIGVLVCVRLSDSTNAEKSLYQQWRTAFLVIDKQDKNTAYIQTKRSGQERTVLSEGQGYGLLLTVKAAQCGYATQKDFDKLDRYYLKNRDAGTALMSWKQTISKKGMIKKFKNNATDGDLYIAYALIEAGKKWPNQAKDYNQQAKKILTDLLKYNYNSETRSLTVGNWATDTSEYSNLLRTSDVLPAQFNEFYRLTQNKTWLLLKDSMLQKLQSLSQQNKTGLLPDFAWIKKEKVIPVKPKAISSRYDGCYYYNACRIPYNLAQSQASLSQRILGKMMNFFMTEETITGGYQLNGKKLNDYQSASFAAPILFAALHNQKYSKLIQQEKFIFIQKLDVNNYYQSTLVVLTAINGLKNH
ncbi:glycosyl hydrolase family 8 [Liquorilactobacillus capillatus]|uniref:glycosyl hydrolase family 8 n=1 Tax=Liquorilactobacillus capillatus TaxID=480931 RepID=UPI00070F424B|nr:glycosyl hydrolase family 8 [Liquorilactobacillus capillatus]